MIRLNDCVSSDWTSVYCLIEQLHIIQLNNCASSDWKLSSPQCLLCIFSSSSYLLTATYSLQWWSLFTYSVFMLCLFIHFMQVNHCSIYTMNVIVHSVSSRMMVTLTHWSMGVILCTAEYEVRTICIKGMRLVPSKGMLCVTRSTIPFLVCNANFSFNSEGSHSFRD